MFMESENSKAYLALIVVCLVWGITYGLIKVAVLAFPPFLFSSIRYFGAGFILLICILLKQELKLTFREIVDHGISGTLILGSGTGLLGWCQQYIPSGIAAMMMSMTPALIILVSYLTSAETQPFNKKMLTGILLGMMGMIVIFNGSIHKLTTASINLAFTIAFVANLSSATGMVYSRRRLNKGGKPLHGAAIQLLAAGTSMIVASLIFDDYTNLRTPTPKIFAILAFLIFVGSILAYSCLVYALTKLPVTICSIYVYVNPIIALIIGTIFLDEPMTTRNLLALMLIICAVYCIDVSSRK